MISAALLAGAALFAPASQNFALHYNGLQESVIPDCPALDISGEITMECWVRPDASDPGRLFRFIISHHGGIDGYCLLLNRLHYAKGTDIGGDQTVELPVGQWSHLALSHSDKLAKIYVNGKLAVTRPVTGGARPFTDHQLCVGCSSFIGLPGDQLTHFSGDIDELRIWSRALNEREIRFSMRHGRNGNERGLVVYLPFDEGKGDMAVNMTGKTPPLRLGRSYRPDEWDPTWVGGAPSKKLLKR